ncbi:MAG TPA: GNAT family N-acetyltransferase [Candidatus Polarisedimenticolaceae bacterium]|nr:GNAT family N-acetyltransferase [Candidatus Polarisedimenticolaceae bacterium]
MTRRWIHESPARWDADKEAVLGAAPPGALDVEAFRRSSILPGDWWRVEEEGRTVAYGFMDAVWGDAEILVAVGPEAQGRGVGGFVLDRLEEEARARGLRYLYNVVRPSHPKGAEVTRWLTSRGFKDSDQGGVLRRRT